MGKKRLNGHKIDILVTNGNHVLVAEMKSSLGVNDGKDLIDDLNPFREFFSECYYL